MMESIKIPVKGKVYKTCPEDGCAMIDKEFVDHFSSSADKRWTPQGYVNVLVYTERPIRAQMHNYIYQNILGNEIKQALLPNTLVYIFIVKQVGGKQQSSFKANIFAWDTLQSGAFLLEQVVVHFSRI
jgi:hypothetical protein